MEKASKMMEHLKALGLPLDHVEKMVKSAIDNKMAEDDIRATSVVDSKKIEAALDDLLNPKPAAAPAATSATEALRKSGLANFFGQPQAPKGEIQLEQIVAHLVAQVEELKTMLMGQGEVLTKSIKAIGIITQQQIDALNEVGARSGLAITEVEELRKSIDTNGREGPKSVARGAKAPESKAPEAAVADVKLDDGPPTPDGLKVMEKLMKSMDKAFAAIERESNVPTITDTRRQELRLAAHELQIGTDPDEVIATHSLK